jgi:hypothetical protein
MSTEHIPEALRIADDLSGVILPDDHEVLQDAACELRSLHAEIQLLKTENASHLADYAAMRAERDALQNRRPKDEAERDAFAAAARPLIEFLSTVHPHHHVLVTPTHAELMEAQMVFKTDEFLKD